MGFIGGIAKAGIAKRIFDEARKPQNQARVKRMIAKARQKRSRGAGTTP